MLTQSAPRSANQIGMALARRGSRRSSSSSSPHHSKIGCTLSVCSIVPTVWLWDCAHGVPTTPLCIHSIVLCNCHADVDRRTRGRTCPKTHRSGFRYQGPTLARKAEAAAARLNFCSISDVAGWAIEHLPQMRASKRDISCASPHHFGKRLAEFRICISSRMLRS